MQLSEIVDPLISWYARCARELPWREKITPYRVWVSEIMLQQTRVEAVKGYFVRFINELPEVSALAQVPEERLLKLWEGLGYYSRARNLQKAARVICEQHGGSLPASYEQLIALPGIGPYTAGAISSIAFGLPEPAVDGNVLRVVSRLRASSADIAQMKVRREIEQDLRAIMPSGAAAGLFNQSLMELGATVCGPNGPPNCDACPLNVFCEGRAQGIATQLPVKAPAKPRRIEERTILVIERDGLIALRRRPSRGLLAGLWELPSLAGKVEQHAQLVAHVRNMGLEPIKLEPLPPSKHIFTHLEWHMTGVRVLVDDSETSQPLVWASPLQVTKKYALPSAFEAYIAPIKNINF